MTARTGGLLDMAALAALTGKDHDLARMQHFAVLDRQRQTEAIQRLAATGMSHYGIARATELAVEQVTQLLESARPVQGDLLK